MESCSEFLGVAPDHVADTAGGAENAESKREKNESEAAPEPARPPAGFYGPVDLSAENRTRAAILVVRCLPILAPLIFHPAGPPPTLATALLLLLFKSVCRYWFLIGHASTLPTRPPMRFVVESAACCVMNEQGWRALVRSLFLLLAPENATLEFHKGWCSYCS